ncbi:MAG TPA: GYD domain-containing protein [Chloroflexota bacterium]|jgi:uncharacterized protein with GYD domain
MPTYVSLLRWTDQGVKNAKASVERAEQASAAVQRLGGRLQTVLWTQGSYDIVTIAEFPDEESATAFLIGLGGQGNVRSETMRAFNAEEMKRILAKLP